MVPCVFSKERRELERPRWGRSHRTASSSVTLAPGGSSVWTLAVALPSIAALCISLALTPIARAAEPASFLGVSRGLIVPKSAPYDVESQSSLTEGERAHWMGLFGRYLDIYGGMGLKTVLVGEELPDLFSWGSVEPKESSYRFLVADLLVEAAGSRGLTLVLPLSSRAAWDHDDTTLIPQKKPEYKEYVRLLVERYDGDLDFGVQPGEEYPDITGDGTVGIADWGAGDDEKQAWADTHHVTWWRLGSDPLAAEQEHGVPVSDYASLVLLTRPVVLEANPDAKLMLAAVHVGEETKAGFMARMEPLRASVLGEPQFDAATVLIDGPGSGLSALEVMESMRDVFAWLEALDYGQTPVWVGGIAAGAAPLPTDSDVGPCGDPRCDEQSQAQQLVKLVVQSLEQVTVQVSGGFEKRAFARVLLREPVEHGPGGLDGDFLAGGIFTLDGGDPALDPISVRPAYATVARLAQALEGIEPGGLVRVASFPDTTVKRVYEVHRDGDVVAYVLWYNWEQDIIDAAYDGRFLRVDLTGLAAPAVRVTPLFPTQVDDVLTGTGAAHTFDEEVLPVVDGAVSVDVRQDAVLVELLAEAPPPVDAGPTDTADAGAADASPDAGPTDVAPPPAATGSDGCRGSGGRPAGGGAVLLLLGMLLVVGRSRAQNR